MNYLLQEVGVILNAVYKCGTSHVIRRENKLGSFEIKLLRRIFGPKKGSNKRRRK
jgi:hypothetical protein